MIHPQIVLIKNVVSTWCLLNLGSINYVSLPKAVLDEVQYNFWAVSQGNLTTVQFTTLQT